MSASEREQEPVLQQEQPKKRNETENVLSQLRKMVKMFSITHHPVSHV